jgi:hypothetical protein
MHNRSTSLFHLWLLYCTWAVLSGWLLSAAGWLGGWGYLASFAACLAVVTLAMRLGGGLPPSLRPFRFRRRRWRKLPPLLYLLVFLMVLLAAVLHAPSNYDALCYRLPRIFQWLAEGRWHWIETLNQAVNTRTSVTEWMQLPLVLLGRSDRLLVLPNLISFALMPGLVFSILRNLGIARRVAWNWMWIFPSGYCYALQAGGIGNDLPGAVLFLAGIHFALRARKSRAWSDFAWACIGMALATGAKTSNVPLGLPWLVAIAPALPLVWRFLPRNLLLAPALVLLSFLPNAWLNHRHCGDWTGLKAEPVHMHGGDPLLYISWNVPYLIIQNLTPPVFPGNSVYNRTVERLIPADLKTRLDKNFEPAAARFYAGEMIMEEGGPLGLGISTLLVVGLAMAWRRRHKHAVRPPAVALPMLPWLVFTATLAALLPMLIKSGLSGSGRYFAPHYLTLILPFLTPASLPAAYRSRIWNIAVGCCFAILMLTLLVSGARPLWPALTVLRSLEADKESASPALQRVWSVYSFYRQRPDAFLPLVTQLPAGVERIGMLSGNTPEASLWKPFGSRRVIHILPTDSPASLRDRGIEYIAAGPRTMRENGFPKLTDWCVANRATIIAEAQVRLMVRYGVETWYLLKLAPESVSETRPAAD